MSKGKRAGETSFLDLLEHLFGYLRHYKALVAAILVLGVLHAVLMKAPLLLIKEVVDTVLPGEGGLAAKTQVVEPQSFDLVGMLDRVRTLLFEWLGIDRLLPQEVGLAQAAVLVAILALLGALTLYFFRVFANLATVRVVVDMRRQICSHLMHLSLRFFAKQRSGDLISTVSNDTAIIQRSFTIFLENAYIEPLMILANAFIAGSVIPWLFWFVLGLAVALAIPMMSFGRKVQKGSRKSLTALGKATDTMSQMFQGFRTVKSFQLEKRQLEEFDRDNERFLQRTMRMVKAKCLSQSLLYALYMLGFAAILLGIKYFVDPAELTRIGPSRMLMALAAIGTTYAHVKRTARTYNMFRESQGAMDRIAVHFGESNEIVESPNAIDLETLRGEVQFENVSFGYDEELVLDGLDFRVEPGQKAAFVGPSGSGKSTLLNLMTRFYDPTAGRILIDGHDLREIRISSYLQHVATVDQAPFLFNTTIRENILLGRPGASEEDMRAAAKAALVDDFVCQLEDGYDTLVHERGTRVSGGQLQRITIARAILRNPAILLLDEATSALDSESERGVQFALDNLMRGRTSFIVAHRLSTIRSADVIFVLDKGRIIERGSHEELCLRTDGEYRRLLNMQSEVDLE